MAEESSEGMQEKARPTPLQVDLEAPESWRRVAHVTASQEMLEGERTKAAREIQKAARIRGFRKGKVPLDVVRRSYGADIEQQALEALIPEAYRMLLRENEDLRPIADPRVENLQMEEGEPVRFDLIVEVRPELKLEGLERIQAEKVVVPITQARVDQALSELQERSARWVPVERAAREGDAILIDYVPVGPEGQPKEEERRKGYALELGAEGVLPEFNAALEGLQPGEDTQVDVHYPQDYPREDLAGQEIRIHVELKEIREKQVPALDDDLAQSISRFQTLGELREDVRRELEKASEAESDRHLRELLIDRIIAAHDIPVPPSLEARYLQAMLEDAKRASRHEPSEDDVRQFRERYTPAAQRAVRRMVILDNLRRSSEIRVTDEDVQGRIEELAAERDVSPEEFRRAVESSNNLDRLRSDLEEDRVFAWLQRTAKVEVVEKDSTEPAAGQDEAAQSKE